MNAAVYLRVSVQVCGCGPKLRRNKFLRLYGRRVFGLEDGDSLLLRNVKYMGVHPWRQQLLSCRSRFEHCRPAVLGFTPWTLRCDRSCDKPRHFIIELFWVLKTSRVSSCSLDCKRTQAGLWPVAGQVLPAFFVELFSNPGPGPSPVVTHTHPGQEEMAVRQLQQGAVVACS